MRIFKEIETEMMSGMKGQVPEGYAFRCQVTTE